MRLATKAQPFQEFDRAGIAGVYHRCEPVVGYLFKELGHHRPHGFPGIPLMLIRRGKGHPQLGLSAVI